MEKSQTHKNQKVNSGARYNFYSKLIMAMQGLFFDSYINPFVPNAPFLYSLKTSENLTVFCFQGVEK